MKEALFGKTLTELEHVASKLGLKPYTARQIAGWLYARRAADIDQMTNLSKDARARLADQYDVGVAPPPKVSESADGTKKYLFATEAAVPESSVPRPAGAAPHAPQSHRPSPFPLHLVEAAYIPESERATLCLSTQVGCKMGCLFCMTGKQGFQGNLTAGEILNQYRSLPETEEVTNIVYMGMGEPFDNPDEVMKSLEILTSPWGFGMSAKRVTVSTIGIIPVMKRFLDETACHLAVSLHSPFDEERRRLMPVQNVYPVGEVIDALRSFDLPRQRRVSFEYIVFAGVNHSPRHVKELARLLQEIRCRINLIHFHPIPGTPLSGASDEQMEAFQAALKAKGIPTTIRKSRGQDIQAACGLLSTRELVRQAAAAAGEAAPAEDY